MAANAPALDSGRQATGTGAVHPDPLITHVVGVDTACPGRQVEPQQPARDAGCKLQAARAEAFALVAAGDGFSLPRPLDARGFVEVVVGYLVTLPDGHECRLGPDRGRAEQYAARNHGIIEPMIVRRTPP